MTVRWTVRSKNRKVKKRHFDPKMAILALFSSLRNVTCVLLTQTNDWCNNERERKGKRIAKGLCFDQDLNPGLNITQQRRGHGGLHSKEAVHGGQSLDRLDTEHCHFDGLTCEPSTLP